VGVFKLANDEAAAEVLAQVQARSRAAVPPRRTVPVLKAPAPRPAAAPPKALPAQTAAPSGDWTEF
jgi:hypothetical protein